MKLCRPSSNFIDVFPKLFIWHFGCALDVKLFFQNIMPFMLFVADIGFCECRDNHPKVKASGIIISDLTLPQNKFHPFALKASLVFPPSAYVIQDNMALNYLAVEFRRSHIISLIRNSLPYLNISLLGYTAQYPDLAKTVPGK